MYINQVPLSQFQIVYAGFPNGLALAAETLRDALAARLSLTLPCGKDTDLAPSPFEVRIGCTNRKQNEAATPLLTYSFTVAGSILQLTCGGAFSACRAVDALCAFLGTQTALSLSDGVFLQTDLRGEMVPRTEESNLRVMTSNILAERWNNHPERYLTTAERAEIYAAVLARYTPDLIGVQETDAPWAEVLPDCLAIVKSVYGLHFQWIEYQFGELANMSSVIFNADRFTLLAKDTVEFSYHVNSGRPYKIRTMAYGVWQDRETDKTMILINTHWATESKFETEQITEESALIRTLCEKYPGAILFCTGDFNMHTYVTFAPFVEATGLIDSKDTAMERAVLKNHVPGIPETIYVNGVLVYIDHIFTNLPKDTVRYHETITEDFTHYLSDHKPQYTDYNI